MNVDTQSVMNVEYLYKISDIQKVNNFIVDSYSKNKKLTRKEYIQLKKMIIQFIQYKTIIIIPEFGIENTFFEIELTTGVYELVDSDIKFLILILNSILKQIHYQ